MILYLISLSSDDNQSARELQVQRWKSCEAPCQWEVRKVQESSYGHVICLNFWGDRCCGNILLAQSSPASTFTSFPHCWPVCPSVCSGKGDGHLQAEILADSVKKSSGPVYSMISFLFQCSQGEGDKGDGRVIPTWQMLPLEAAPQLQARELAWVWGADMCPGLKQHPQNWGTETKCLWGLVRLRTTSHGNRD